MSNATKTKSEQPQASDALRQLIQRAERGDLDTLPALRMYLDTTPEVWQQVGNLAFQAEHAWTTLAAGPDLVLGESVKRQIGAMKAEIAGPDASPLEKILADRVILSWLHTHYADIVHAQSLKNKPSIAQADYLGRCQDRAQRRLLQAAKSLALVRKLLPATASTLSEEDDAAVAAVGDDYLDEGPVEVAPVKGRRTSATKNSKHEEKRRQSPSDMPRVLRDRTRSAAGVN